ncbi:hypothetical protein ACIPY6_08295 [Streptomyces sp. NPDC090054]|uniref:hypothetical protein n=1 Tax=Streptomyces sp. NPDC090054 TaxID=3365933 RepID=UPI003813CE77
MITAPAAVESDFHWGSRLGTGRPRPDAPGSWATPTRLAHTPGAGAGVDQAIAAVTATTAANPARPGADCRSDDHTRSQRGAGQGCAGLAHLG